jgi:hypothetical protein
LVTRLFNVAVALAALVGTSATLHRVLPQTPVENVSPKLRFFAEHKDEFDTLFIGTSRIQHHVSPQLFDHTTAAAGHATHSFNFGVDGMHPPENFYVTEQILALKPRRLKWVFTEFEDMQLGWSRDVGGTRRLAYWHTWKWTALSLDRAINPRGESAWYGKLGRVLLRRREIVMHLYVFARRFANVGQVADLIQSRSVNRDAEMKSQLGPAGDGYQPPLAPMRPERVARYTQKLQSETSSARPRLVDPYSEKTYRDHAARFAALGARTFFVLTPVASQSPLRFRSPPPPPGPVLLFNDARKYPQLFDPAVRADEGHMSQQAADEFTRLLAQEFLKMTSPR